MSPPGSPTDVGQLLAPEVMFSWGFGLIVVVLYGWNKFYEEIPSLKSANKDRVISQIYMKDLTVHRAFTESLIIYLAILLFMFVAITLFGRGLGIERVDKVTLIAWPTTSALLMVGLLPNLPWFSQVELWLRGMMHNRAMIIRSVEDTKSELAAASQNLQALSAEGRKELFRFAELEAQFESGDLPSELENWVKTSFIVRSVRKVLRDANRSPKIGRSFFEKYKIIWDRILDEHDSISMQLGVSSITDYRSLEQAAEKLKPLIDKNYDDVYSFISCAVVNRAKRVQMSTVLDALRLNLSQEQIADIRNASRLQFQADAILFAFFFSLGAVAFLYVSMSFLNGSIVQLRPDWARTWPRIEAIGGNLFNVVAGYIWVGLGIFVFFLYRKFRLEDDDWYRDRDGRQADVVAGRSYLRAAILVLVVLGLFLLLIDALAIIGTSNKCEGGVLVATCTDFLWQKLTAFFDRNWLRLCYGVAACVITFVLVERFTAKARLGMRAALGVAVLCALVIGMEFIGKYHLAAAQVRNTADPIDTAYLYVAAIVSAVFWVTFLEKARRHLIGRAPS
jgi:hypothetical protein